MMNCIPSIPGRDRYNARISSPEDDDESVQDFYRAHPCTLEKEKAEQMDSVLSNAITMAERDSGSILCLQLMNEMNAVELGRRISTFRSMKDYEETKEEPPHDLNDMAALTSSHSFQSAASLPTFLKVERGTPAILTQKSWETISRTDSESEEDCDSPEGQSKSAPIVTPLRSRSWNKLRKTISKEERSAKQEKKKQSKRGIVGSSSPRRLNLFSRRKPKEDDTKKSYAKDSDVEVSLQSEKKRGWGSRLRRRNKKATKKDGDNSRSAEEQTLPLMPTFIPMEISREAEEEDFFLNDLPTKNDDMTIEEQTLEDSIRYDEEQIPIEESMEVMNQGSCFDIIGASNILKGLETSWKELTEDSFDVVPRPQ